MGVGEFQRLCTPAKLYFAIAVIASVVDFFGGMPVVSIVWKLIFAFIWTYALSWLCRHGHRNVSWFLVLLPYIIMALAGLSIWRISAGQQSILRMLKLQGAFGQEAMSTMPKKK